MNKLLLLLLLFGASPLAFADSAIYRNSDKLVVGAAYGTQDPAVELNNILLSELGGVASDYTIVEANGPIFNKALSINPGGQLVAKAYSAANNNRPEETQDIPIEDFGAGVAGALAVLAGQGFVIKAQKKRSNNAGGNN